MAAPAPAPPSRSDPITLDDQEINGKDFGFVPIPRRLRHDPRKPHPWNLTLNIVFGLASTFTVANLYYCQPILIQLSQSFSVSYNDVSRIPTLVQAGYAVGLLFISPLGDLLPRRPLILILTFLAPSLTVILPLTSSLPTFSAVSFLIGILSITPQVLMPLAADLAPPSRRASALSIALSGLLLGILIARVLAGVVAQFVSWRIVYWVAFAVQWAVLGLEWACIPDYPSKNKKGEGLTYARIPWTMMRFLWTEPVVVQAVLICIASMSTFTNFWVTLTFLLGGPPYFYSTLAIGLFGLIGIAGVAFAPLIGRLVDHLSNWTATMISTVVLVGVWVVETGEFFLN
ncbi:MFS general substrate transporter [Panus rudis PR-1116 ss-1]|nr:MFS general substrate transporter [Panus rudis PR-1116 ss-1]